MTTPNPTVQVGNAVFANGAPLALIAGPCQLESRQHAFDMAGALVEMTRRLGVGLVYKTSYDKANRTSLAGVRGAGLDAALPIFADLRAELGVPVLTDVHSHEQCGIVASVVDVLQIPETSIVAHLNWATWHFQDIAQRRTGGRNPFGNMDVVYRGSDDDAALNKGVLRYAADPDAVAALATDTDPTGRIGVPVISLHAIGDPTAFVELESAFRETMQRGGSAQRLVQTFTEDHEHSYLNDPVYPTLLAALLQWVERGDKPTPAAIAARCQALQARFGPGCRFVPDYQPAPLAARVAPRN